MHTNETLYELRTASGNVFITRHIIDGGNASYIVTCDEISGNTHIVKSRDLDDEIALYRSQEVNYV